MKFKTFPIRATSVAALLLSMTGARAADLPTRAAPPVYVPPSPVFTWTGFYVGANIGYGGDRYRYPFSIAAGGATLVAGEASLTSSGVLGGGQAGYNYAFGNHFIAGIEADFDGASISGRVALNAGIPGAGTLSASAGSRMEYFGTVRGRVGYAFDRVMIYGTGGFAYSRVHSSVDASLAGLGTFNAGVSTNHTGYAVGGGIEYAITNNLTFKTEYIRAEFNTKQLAGGAILGAAFALREKPSLNIVRAGLNYKFDWFGAPAPVVARY
jgi:outer membrane immunogenic protein